MKIANIIYPTASLCMDESLYFRVINLAWYSYDEKILHLKMGSEVLFDTYFNALSIGKWRKYTTIKEFVLSLETKGHLLCTLYHLDERHIVNTISVTEIKPQAKITNIKIPHNIQDGIVYFVLKAIDDSIVYSSAWETDQKAERNIRLGLSITTFNRQDAVSKSTQRILEFLRKTDINADLLVVDNGKNVELAEDEKLTYIPNENLGGSGGFARGLYHLKEENSEYTHSLFMDDDASCETESIYRTYRLLEYAEDDKLAISGSMLLGNEPNIQWENGANFDIHCQPLKSLYNLHNRYALIDNEDDIPFDYGGWWFFAFPIKYSEYPYPFFVRGDDVNFGLQEQFNQITMNGIATWGDDFFDKESPFTQYLDTRSHILHHLQVPKLDQSYLKLMKVFWRFVVRYSFMYKYASVEAQIEAIRDVLKGPQFFEENISMKEIFSKLSQLTKEEKPKFIDLQSCKHYDRVPEFRWPLFMRTVKILTLNGHLIPKIFFKHKNIVLDKTEHRIGSYFRRTKVCIYNKRTKEGFFLYHDKKRFFNLWRESIKLSWQMYREHKELKQKYQNRYPYLTSKEYWKKQFFPEKRE